MTEDTDINAAYLIINETISDVMLLPTCVRPTKGF